MLRIGICDDDMEQIALVKMYLANYCIKNRADFKVVISQDANDFFQKTQGAKLDIALLDIEIGESNGIDLALEMRKADKETVIIFITGYADYAYRAFQVRAFHYLAKPITEEQFMKAIDEALEEIENRKYIKDNKYQKFQITTKAINKELPYDDILYFEKIDKKVIVHCVREEIEYRTTMNTVEDELDQEIFYRCHQGYIVNINKVNFYKDGIVYIGEKQLSIPVSKNNIKKMREAIAKKLLD